MSCSGSSRWEEAEKARTTVLTLTGATCAGLAWLCRGSSAGVAAVAAISAYLLTGDRYQWIYLLRRTAYRDFLGLRVLIPTMLRLRMWERQGASVVSLWSETVKKYPNKAAFIMGDRSFTFRQGDEFSNRIAWYFRRQGFKRGEVIALVMETRPEFILIWLGLAKAGVVASLVNSSLRGSQLLHCLKVASCKAVIYGNELSEAIAEIQPELAHTPMFQFDSPDNIGTSGIVDGTILSTEINEMPTDMVPDAHSARPRDTLLYIYTSGTTGFPKAAIITNIRYLMIASGLHSSARLQAMDIVYDPLPLHHTAGGVLGVGQALINGCTLVLRTKFSASNYWKDCARYRCTVGQYIGEICRYLLTVPPSPADKEHCIRIMVGNGLRPQIWKQFVERFGIDRVCEFYGATEGNSNLVNLDSKPGAIGFLCRLAPFNMYPLILVRCDEVTGEILRDSNGRCIPCGPNEPGLFLGNINPKKALLTFSGYADKTESAKKMVRNVKYEGDCYFNTGDILVMDHLGYFYFRDRTGDTFRWKGENVSTAEVEGVISSLAGLKDAIVFGVSIPHLEGKAGLAAISDPEKKLDITKLAKGLKSSLPVYARPLFLRILPETPMTATFKLKKKELMLQGFDPSLHKDPMYFLDQKTGEFVPLTQTLYDDIVNSKVRL